MHPEHTNGNPPFPGITFIPLRPVKLAFAAACFFPALTLHAQPFGTWERPYTAESIWNTPIGSRAVYVDAELDEAFHHHFTSDEAATDRTMSEAVVLYREEKKFPETKIFESTWTNRCDPIELVDHTIHFPADFLYNSTPRTGNVEANGAWAFLWADGTLRAATIFGRCEAGGPLQLPPWAFQRSTRIDGDGLTDASGHGASGMSGLGGLLRVGELSSDEPIRHPLKLTWPAWVYAYYQKDRKGFRWPARLADGYATRPDRYIGEKRELVMGSLLAIQSDVEIDALTLTEIGKKLATAMQHYGVYLVEDCGPGPNENWERWQLMIELDATTGKCVHEEAKALGYDFGRGKGESGGFKDDMNVILPLLHIVDNNGPDSIGGGGEPLVDRETQ